MQPILKTLAIGIFLVLGSSSAYSQCSGNPAAGRLCGNASASATLPGWQTMTSMLDRNFGAPSTQGTILNRGASVWSATASPTLGLNGGNGGAVILEGSSTGSATIGVKAAAGSTTFNLPVGNGALNNVLITDGAGNTSWAAAGGGTVSSVGLSLPGIFTVTNSPVTTTGTLTGSLNTQNANIVWAGPTTGAAATPTFRSLVGADLPNPSSSSLGGVQSFAAVDSQWIRQISTSGVPTASQPAFTDISGAITAAQCVLPTVSTVGCVEAINAVASNWIRSISTSGVPSLSQPNFTDLVGNATLGQLPSISSGAVLGNNSGGTAVPSPLTASNVLDFIATTQGDVLYRNGSIWTALPPGTNGQVLTSGGAAANPSWTTVTGTGTVTNIATNNGLTGGAITTTGTIGLATITAGSVMANITGGSAVPIANTPSSILDLIGSTAGDILYRSSGGGWTVLAPGTNGQVLTQGASTPSWSNAGTLTNVTISPGTGIGATGTCNITTTGTCTVGLTAARQTLPTHTALTSGSGTYSTPANVLWIEIELIGGGGGGGGGGFTGAGSGSNGNPSCWNTTGSACTSPVYSAGGGAAGAPASGGGGGTSGSGSGSCDWAAVGGGGGGGASNSAASGQFSAGGTGGSSSHGGGGGSNQGGAGLAGGTNAGGGGGGGGTSNGGASANAGGGGGGGGTCHVIIGTPASTYTYAVGGTASGGTAGTGGAAGGIGAAGIIIVYEHYGT